MSHIDEGQLHALLDDALEPGEATALRQHIDACPQCAARLEEEQTLRLRSIAILDAARPAADSIPPFETVLQRARVEPSARRFQMPGPTRLAWAATIVLALGIGWFGRDFAPRADLQSSKLETSARETAPLMSEPAAAPVSPPPASAPVANALGNVARENAATPSGSTGGFARGTVTGTASEPQQAGQRLQSVETRAAERSADVQFKTAQSIAAARDSQQHQGQQVQQQVTPLQQQQQLRRDSGVARQAAANANQASGGAGRGGRGGGGGRDIAVVAAPPVTPQPAPVAAAALAKIASEAWEYLDLARGEQRIGRTILVVPGLQVDSVGVLNTVAGYRVRLTHRLPSGDPLELLQEPVTLSLREVVRARQETDAPQATTVPGIVAVTINRPDVILTGRARISADSLRALLQRVR